MLGKKAIGTFCLSACAIFGSMALTAPAQAEDALFTYKEIPALGGRHSMALGMNNRGVVVGIAETRDEKAHAFMWKDDVIVDLQTLGGDRSEARAINDREQIVGYSKTASGARHAFYAYEGQMLDLNDLVTVLPWEDGIACNAGLEVLIEANDISADGRIIACGRIYSDSAMHAFLLTPVNDNLSQPKYLYQDLGQLFGEDDCWAYSLNEQGQVVGVSGERPFIWEYAIWGDDSIVPLDHGAVIGEATAINDAGTVVGWAGKSRVEPRASMWVEGGVRFTLMDQDETLSEALAINRHGQVVGWAANTYGGESNAMLWDGTCAGLDLNESTVFPVRAILPPVHLEIATAIDDQRRIIGWGTSGIRIQAFMLVPVAIEE